MKKHIYKIFIFLLVLSGCEIDDQVNPNNQSLEAVLVDAKQVDLDNLVTGILARMRVDHDTYVVSSGSVARELYVFDADPRNRTDLLGYTESSLDNNTFYITAPWNQRYRTIKNCNILIEATTNAHSSVSAGAKDGYIGFAKTIMAHQFLLLINYTDTNGLRLDVANPDALGTIESKEKVLTTIITMLGEAQSTLASADFIFSLSAGFENFNTPTTFLTFNRALAARAALYAGDNDGALAALTTSFIDVAGNLSLGPKMTFSTDGADILNGLFKFPRQNGDQIVVNDGHISDAEAGDSRLNKMALRDSPTLLSGFGGAYETRLFTSNDSPIDIIRNEELILIRAEARIMRNTGTDLADAITDLNIIRVAAGVGTYSGASTKADLIDELLHQRRYSLWGEGHRMGDLRRHGRLNAANVPVDKQYDDDKVLIPQIVFTEFPIPITEPEK